MSSQGPIVSYPWLHSYPETNLNNFEWQGAFLYGWSSFSLMNQEFHTCPSLYNMTLAYMITGRIMKIRKFKIQRELCL